MFWLVAIRMFQFPRTAVGNDLASPTPGIEPVVDINKHQEKTWVTSWTASTQHYSMPV